MLVMCVCCVCSVCFCVLLLLLLFDYSICIFILYSLFEISLNREARIASRNNTNKLPERKIALQKLPRLTSKLANILECLYNNILRGTFYRHFLLLV